MKSVIICKECKRKFVGDRHGESIDFDLHECANIVDPPLLVGESFESWKERCKSHASRDRIGS